MAMEKQQLSITKTGYANFLKKHRNGKFGSQTLGQAFYAEFNLHKVVDQTALKNLQGKDGEHAKGLIQEIFKIK
jgi:hypothetical protein